METKIIADIYAKTGENGVNGGGVGGGGAEGGGNGGGGSGDVIMPGAGLDMGQLYQDYVTQCRHENHSPVSQDDYVRTFRTEYDLSTVQV